MHFVVEPYVLVQALFVRKDIRHIDIFCIDFRGTHIHRSFVDLVARKWSSNNLLPVKSMIFSSWQKLTFYSE